MSRTIENSLIVDASTTAVWSVLTDFKERSEWDPYYRSISGDPTLNARLTVFASLNDNSQLVKSHPRIVALEPIKQLAWVNRFFLPGLLDSKQVFMLTPTVEGKTLLTQREQFSGIAVALSRTALDDVEARLTQWIEAIKQRVEAHARSGQTSPSQED